MKKSHEDHSNMSVLEVDQSSSRLTVGNKIYHWSWEGEWGSEGREHICCWERIRGRESKDVTNSARIKKLNKLLQRALDEHEATQKAKLKLANSISDSRYGIPVDSESDSAEEESQEKPAKKAPVPSSTDGEIKRDKYGVKLFSYGGKYYFTMCVNKSRKYPDHTSLRFSMAGRNLLFTLGKSEVKAFVREAHRGLTTGELMEILGKRPYIRQGRT